MTAKSTGKSKRVAGAPAINVPRPTSVTYWRQRLVRRRHTELARPNSARELFARIEYAGDWAFYPLGSNVPAVAALKAREIYLRIAREGWAVVRQKEVHEFTLAIFWLSNPLTATYATLFTRPESTPAVAGAGLKSADSLNVAIIETSKGVRQALLTLLQKTAGFSCVAALSELREIGRLRKAVKVDVVLFNQHSAEASEDMGRRLRREAPGIAAFGYGVYRNSDELFVTITGVDGGYFLRRRTPGELFEPLNGWRTDDPIASGETASLSAQNYFAGVLRASSDRTQAGAGATLTNREYEILTCVSRGIASNKAISGALKISAWTVSAHLKSIFRKLGVHSRTEAVMKFLQR